jgi:hypothetical protein
MNTQESLLAIPTLETERLWLRPFRSGDFEDYAALNADPEVLRHLGSGAQTWGRGRSWRHLAFLMGHWQLGGAGMWALEHRETGAFVGTAGFAAPDGWPGFELAGSLASAALVGAGLCDRGRARRPRSCFQRPGEGARHQPDSSRESGLHPGRRTDRRTAGEAHRPQWARDAPLWARPGNVSQRGRVAGGVRD